MTRDKSKEEIIIPLDYQKIVRPNTVVHCKTEIEDKQLRMWANSVGLKWSTQKFTDKSYFPEYQYTTLADGGYCFINPSDDHNIVPYKDAIKYEAFSILNYKDAEHLIGRMVEYTNADDIAEDTYDWDAGNLHRINHDREEPFNVDSDSWDFIRTILETYADLLEEEKIDNTGLIEALEMSIKQWKVIEIADCSKNGALTVLGIRDTESSCLLCGHVEDLTGDIKDKDCAKYCINWNETNSIIHTRCNSEDTVYLDWYRNNSSKNAGRVVRFLESKLKELTDK